MELRQLEYLVAVAEERSFTRAAARVHISQSGVSAQIKQLELELGATLIDRASRQAKPTAAGEAALAHARAAISSARAVRQAVDDVTGLISGRLVIGMVIGCTIGPLFEAVAALHREHPGIEIALTEDNSDQLIARLRAGEADLALVGIAGAAPAELESLQIVSEGLIAAFPAGHPLNAPGSNRVNSHVTLQQVTEHPLICLPRGTGVRAVFDRACAAVGLESEIALQASAPDAVADLAARGLGIAVLSASMEAARDPRLTTLGISGIQTEAVLALVWRPNPGPALLALLQQLHASFGVGTAAGHTSV
jgi:DNA-binding transcriptional LysR family regulator